MAKEMTVQTMKHLHDFLAAAAGEGLILGA